jgi:hypothetical protein
MLTKLMAALVLFFGGVVGLGMLWGLYWLAFLVCLSAGLIDGGGL